MYAACAFSTSDAFPPLLRQHNMILQILHLGVRAAGASYAAAGVGVTNGTAAAALEVGSAETVEAAAEGSCGRRSDGPLRLDLGTLDVERLIIRQQRQDRGCPVTSPQLPVVSVLSPAVDDVHQRFMHVHPQVPLARCQGYQSCTADGNQGTPEIYHHQRPGAPVSHTHQVARRCWHTHETPLLRYSGRT